MAPTRKDRIFISHSSADLPLAREIEKALGDAGLDVWLDASDIELGALLRQELHTAIDGSRAAILLWSEPASRSRWVAAEILLCFHMGRFLFPCVVDGTGLPQFLAPGVYLDLRRNPADSLRRLVEGVRKAPAKANPIPPVVAAESEEVRQAIENLAEAQLAVTDAMGQGVAKARKLQKTIDPVMKQAEQTWKYERLIRVLGGYHRKNAYLLNHWEAVQAGAGPKDPILIEAERCFFDALFIDPLEISAINGLGSILILERELDAAEFFVRRAIALGKEQEIDYDAALQDLATIERFRKPGRFGR